MRLRRSGMITGLCLLMAMASTASAKTEEEYQEEIRTLQKRNMQLENTLEEGSQELKRFAEQVNVLREQVSQMTASGGSDSKEVKEMREAIKQLKAQVQTLLAQQGGADAEKKVQALEKQLNTALQQTQELQQKLKTAEKDKAKLQQDAAKSSVSKEADAQAKKLQQNLELLQSQMKSQQQEFSSQQQRLQEELQKVQTEYELQKNQYKANLAILQEKEDELQALRQESNKQTAADPRVAELDAMLAEMNNKLVKISQEKTALETQLKESIASQTATTDMTAKEQLKSAELAKEVARLQGLLEVAEQQTKHRQTTAQQENSRIAELEQQLAEMTSNASQLTEKNAMMLAQMEEQASAQKLYMAQIEKERGRADGYAQEVTRLQSLVDAAEQQATQQKNTALKGDSRSKELETSLAQMNDKLLKLSQEKAAIETQLTEQITSAKLQAELLAQERQNAEDFKRKASQLEATLETTQLQIRQQNASTKEGDARVTELEAMLSELNSRLLKMSQQKADLETRLADQSAAENQKTQQIYALEQQIAKLQGSLDASKQQATQEQQTTQQINRQINDLETQLAEANAKVLELSNNNIRLEAQLGEKQGSENLKVQELTKEIARLQGLLDSSQQKAAQQEMSTQQIDARISELETQLAQANIRATEVSAENARLESLLTERKSLQQDDVTKTQTEISRLKGELRKAAEYVNTRNAEMLAMKEENRLLTAKITRYEENQTSLQTKLASHSTDLEEQSLTVQQLQARFAETQAKLEQNEQEMASLINERNSLKNDVETIKQQNAALQVELANQEQQITRQTSVPEDAKKRIQELVLELQDAKVKLDKLGRLETEYPAAQKELADLKIELASLRDAHGEVATLRPELQDLKQNLEQSRREAEMATAQSEKLQQELARKAETYQMQQQQYDDIAARNSELEEQYQKGQADLQVKERLLQQALTEKSILEKVVDEEDLTSASMLKVKLQEAEERNAALQAQLESRQTNLTELQRQPKETKDVKSPQPSNLSEEVTLRLAALEEQVIEERVNRQQLENELQTARQQLISVKTVQQGTPSGISGGGAMFFPAEMIKSSAGGTISILNWSNDRKKIAYLESTQKMEQLWVLDTQTRQPAKITEWQLSSAAPRINRFDWAYDNQHFLFSTGLPGKFALYVGDSSRLIGTPIQIFDQTIAFAWSPNQLQFAYFSGSQLMVQSPQGNALPIQIGHAQGKLPNTLAWSPDGSQIAFSAKKDGSMDIFVLLFSNNSPLLQTLVASPSDDIQPSWSPDGTHIAFYVNADKFDTKIAVTPADKSRAPYIVAHNVSLPSSSGPQWMTATTLQYIGDEAVSASQNSLYRVDVKTGQRSSVPLAMAIGQ